MTRQLSTLCLLGLLVLAACSAQPTTSEVVKALENSANAGDIKAQYELGVAYDTGSGVKRNGALATQWYRKAAEVGYVEAQNSLGSVLQAEKKYGDARGWFEKAAAKGHGMATNNLAYLYDLGLGVPQNRKKAQSLYLRAADLGCADAMFNLANMYGAGQVGGIDFYQAYIWCDRSARYAQPQSEVQKRSIECIGYLNRELSSEQIQRAQSESGKWSPNQAPKPTQ